MTARATIAAPRWAEGFALFATVVLLALAAALWAAQPAHAVGSRFYTEQVGGVNAFGGTSPGLEETATALNHTLSLAHDPADPSGASYLGAGTYDSGPLTLKVNPQKWITSIAASATIPASTTVGIEYSADGRPFVPLGAIAQPIVATTIRFRITLASEVASVTPVLGGIDVGFYLEKPKKWTPPKPAPTGSKTTTRTGGAGTGGVTPGTGGSGSGGSGVSAGAPSSSSNATGTGAAPGGGGLPADAGTSLVPAGSERVEGLVMKEESPKGSKEDPKKVTQEQKLRTWRTGAAVLGLLYLGGLLWVGTTSAASQLVARKPWRSLTARLSKSEA